LRVLRTEELSLHMRRIILGGPALAGFPADSEGAHIKLLLARPGQSVPVLPTLGPEGPVWPGPDVRPIARTYTVSTFDPDAGELGVDFVLHGDDGPASSWAARAKAGDAIGVAGPGGPRRFVPDAACFLLFGDPSALAAIAAVLSQLPAGARGHALIEVADSAHIVDIARPQGITMHWLIRGAARAGASTLLLEAARRLRWPASVSVTLAGESSQTVALRRYLLDERQVPADAMYAVPYWKDSHTEEAYHAERHRIMDSMRSGDGV